ncbi:MAG: FAD binding domain-containing protein, partial [Acidobacteria bacterium]|nr:FAD binding domain-containing protein [Acidobacteriota bacterium]
MNNFSYSRPATLRDAAAQLGSEKTFGRTAILAGGTDLLGEMKDHLASPERLVPIRHLKELQGIRSMNGGVRIGASTLLADIVENPIVQQQTPLLAMAAGTMSRRVALILVIATIPAGLVGVLFGSVVETSLRAPVVIAVSTALW